MNNKGQHFLQRATWSRALVYLGVTFLLMMVVNAVDLPFTVPHLKSIGAQAEILDEKLFYTPETVAWTLEHLGAAGRETYQNMFLYFDFVFPVVYTWTIFHLLAVSWKPRLLRSGRTRRLFAWPLLAGLCDYMENVSVLYSLSQYPQSAPPLDLLAGYFTLGKWTFMMISLVLVVIGPLWTRRERRNGNTSFMG
jgi:hypothetical protein